MTKDTYQTLPAVQLSEAVFQGILQELKKLGVRITGSYADGTSGQDSDLDFYVTREQLAGVKQLLAAHGLPWGSSTIGHVFTRSNRNAEFYCGFNKRAGRLPTADVLGVTFRTW